MKNTLPYIFLLTLLAHSSFSTSQSINHWETIIKVGDSCKYLVPNYEPSASWMDTDFDDSSWSTGVSGFGYGDGDDQTELPKGTQSVYMRFEFSVEQVSDIKSLILDMDYDDGFMAYLNGAEIARENMDRPTAWNVELKNIHEATMYQGENPERIMLDHYITSLLKTGKNVLAIEVHNETASSSDLSSNVFLHCGLVVEDQLYGPITSWFTVPESYDEFNLPLLAIYTNGQKIPDEPRIVADMGIIDNGKGNMNTLKDPWNGYSGNISIEQRGETSSHFAKKSYSLELQKKDGSNNNVSILGLPEENDFVLYGPYSDKTMVKNVLTYELFRSTGRWAPRTRYVEVFLNDGYQGIYVLTEKLKRDENRVDIDKITPEDTSPVDISGGYILRRDKTKDLSSELWWTSPVRQPYHETMWYEYYDPEYMELSFDQANYIRDWMEMFDEKMSSDDFNDPENGYKNFIKVKSFIDMMFINEISKGIDNYLFSTYFHKENDDDGGQLIAGPPWDYNLGYGNLNYGDGWNAKETYGWSYPQGSRVYWFERLMEDKTYRNKVFCRWTKFRSTIFSDQNVIGIVDSCVMEMGDAVDRNFNTYQTLGKYVWPAIEPYPTTYEGEISNLKNWLIGRLAWMDGEWLNQGYCNSEPPSDIRLTYQKILEHEAIGTEIGRIKSSDNDNDEHDYSLVSGEGDQDNSSFFIEGSSLKSNMVFDYRTKQRYSVRLKAEEDGVGSFEKDFEIEIVSNGPTKIETPTEFALAVYPNPTSDGIQLRTNHSVNQNVTIQLLETSGKSLFGTTGSFTEINTQLFNVTSNLKSGYYLVKIQLEKELYTKGFMKL